MAPIHGMCRSHTDYTTAWRLKLSPLCVSLSVCLACLAALQVRIVLCMVVALILASVYAGQTQDTAADLIGFVGVIFLSTMFIGAINTNAIIQGACVPQVIWRVSCPLPPCASCCEACSWPHPVVS